MVAGRQERRTMIMADNSMPIIELSDAELDLVTGGAGQGGVNAVGAAGGLVNAAVGAVANVRVAVDNVANHNDVLKNVFIDVL